MTILLRDDEGEIRLMGSRAFIRAALERITAAVEVSYDGNLRANRHGDGYRAHAHIRLTSPTAAPVADTAGAPSPRATAEQATAEVDLRAQPSGGGEPA
jgi:hypothetical protein